MKRFSLITIVLILMCSTAANGSAASICDVVNIPWMSTQIPLPQNARIIFKQESGALCEIILSLNGNIVPVYAGNGFILAGQLFKDRQSVTQATLNTIPDVIEKEKRRAAFEKARKKEKARKFLKANAQSLEKRVSLSFTPEHADKAIYVITDPRCSHCKQLLPGLKEVGRKSHTKINVIIYPLLGAESKILAAHAICNQYTFDQYLDIAAAKPAPCPEANIFIDETLSFFRSGGLSSVPAVVAADGSWVVDNNDINRIKLHLGIKIDAETDEAGETCNQE